MTLAEALEIVIARTKHEPYRDICDDGNPDLAQRDGMREFVMRLARGEVGIAVDVAARPSARAALRHSRLAESCPYRSKEPGCCTGYLAWCSKAVRGRITQVECIACQAEVNPSPIPPPRS